MKLSSCTKEQIRDFLELSNKVADLKNIYSKLLIQSLFLQKLKQIKYLLAFKQYNCCIVNQSQNKANQLLIEKTLKISGVTISETNNSLIDIYIQDKAFNFHPIEFKKIIYVSFNLENQIKIKTPHECINFSNNADYGLNILKLLLKITQKSEISTIIDTFNRESQNIKDGFLIQILISRNQLNHYFKIKK